MNSATASLFCCEQFGERSEGQLQRHHETAQLAVEMGSDVNLLAFFDPLLRSPPLIVEPHHRPARKRQVRHDKVPSGKQLPRMMFYLRHHPSGRLPTLGLVQKPLVLHQRLCTGPSHRTRQQFGNVSFQVVIGRNADGVLHAPILQRFVNLRLGKGCVGPECDFLSPSLLFSKWRCGTRPSCLDH